MKRHMLGLCLVLALAAWSGDALAQGLTTTGTAAEPALLGTYTAGPFTVEEVAVLGFDKATICENSGTFVMNLRRGGWSLDTYPLPGCIASNPAIVGSWRLLPDNVLAIRELQDTGCGTEEYTYAWTLEDGRLMLNAVRDPCTPRIYFFTAHPWRKIPEGAQPDFR